MSVSGCCVVLSLDETWTQTACAAFAAAAAMALWRMASSSRAFAFFLLKRPLNSGTAACGEYSTAKVGEVDAHTTAVPWPAASWSQVPTCEVAPSADSTADSATPLGRDPHKQN